MKLAKEVKQKRFEGVVPQAGLEGIPQKRGIELVADRRNYKSYYDEESHKVFTMLKPAVKVDFARIVYAHADILLPDKVGSDWACDEESFLAMWAKLTGMKAKNPPKAKAIPKRCLACTKTVSMWQ
jgi:hypothetical protein